MAYKHPPITMKKISYVMLLLAMLSLCVTSCSKDDDVDLGTFDYPKDELFGKWNASTIHVKGSLRWIIVEDYPRYKMSITFNSDGTFSGEGYLGNGSGTYRLFGKTITTYIDGKVYITYTVNDLSSGVANITATMGGESIDMYVYKSSK